VRVEGGPDHGYVNWFGNNLKDRLDDIQYEVAQEVCERTDYCYYDEEGRLHKNF